MALFLGGSSGRLLFEHDPTGLLKIKQHYTLAVIYFYFSFRVFVFLYLANNKSNNMYLALVITKLWNLHGLLIKVCYLIVIYKANFMDRIDL